MGGEIAMFDKLREFLIGKPLKSEEIHGEKFNVPFGLSILSSDAISSVAYASEEILWVLVPIVGFVAYQFMFYDALAIIVLLLILVFSYRQTINSYPSGGGAYIVAKDNLGVIPGLVAGASLSVDYILTVAVSVSAGTAAITSAFPSLLNHRISIALFFVALLMVGNLRGVRESAKIFAFPPYLFIFAMLSMIVYGIYKVKVLGYVPEVPSNLPQQVSDITVFLFLRAFAAGCTALTGVEAVSNGIPNFKEPAAKNAIRVLFLLATIIFIMFGGISYLATLYHAVPSVEKTVISEIAVQVFGTGFMFYFVQAATAIILVLAANTAYSGFPLLLAIIAKDGYTPKQLKQRGQRLSFSNGIIFLTSAAALLIIIFRGETHYLIPLYAVGVFISFTLSQSGMVVKWFKQRHSDNKWFLKAGVNGFGAIITFITVIIIGVTKFLTGAWIVLVLIPLLVYFMMRVKDHYQHVTKGLKLSGKVPALILSKHGPRHFIVLVESLNMAVFKAIDYAKCLSDDIVAFHVSIDEEETEKLKKRWQEYNIGIPLIIKESPYRELIKPLLNYIESDEHASKWGEMITIVMPQFVVEKAWENALHNQTHMLIRTTLLNHNVEGYANITVISVPYLIEEFEEH
jgi:amino acid transporter